MNDCFLLVDRTQTKLMVHQNDHPDKRWGHLVMGYSMSKIHSELVMNVRCIISYIFFFMWQSVTMSFPGHLQGKGLQNLQLFKGLFRNWLGGMLFVRKWFCWLFSCIVLHWMEILESLRGGGVPMGLPGHAPAVPPPPNHRWRESVLLGGQHPIFWNSFLKS